MMFDGRIGAALRRGAKLAVLPWTSAWAIANRRGWLPEHAVGNSPHLDPFALERWRDALSDSNVYLEYGSGGSTVEAVRAKRCVVSVETDLRYLSAVGLRVAENADPQASFHPVYANIGWTEKWGRPLVPLPTGERLELWRRYPSAPWPVLRNLRAVPDFIFVDGRFRAASVLESLLRLPAEADCLFMLDDFERRERNYGIVRQFATDVEVVGRAIVFRRSNSFDQVECRRLLRICQADPE